MSNYNYSDALKNNNSNKTNYSFSTSCNQQSNTNNNSVNNDLNNKHFDSPTASYNLFNKNFSTYMKYSDMNNIIDINMALASSSNTNDNDMLPTTQLKNANSFELDQFKAEKLFNNTKEARLNDLLAAATLSIKYNNDNKHIKSFDHSMDHSNINDYKDDNKETNGFFLKRQSNGIQSNLFQYCDTQQPNTNNTTTATTTSANKLSSLKKEINTIAIDQVLDKLTNSIKNDKKLSSNIRFNNETTPLESSSSSSAAKSSVCSSSSASSSSSSSSCSSSRTESNEKPHNSNLISLNHNRHAPHSNQASKDFENFLINKAAINSKISQQQQLKSQFSLPLTAVASSASSSDVPTTPTAAASTSSSSNNLAKAQFNIENELIKYTKTLKLTNQLYTDFYKLGIHIRNGGFSEIYEGIQIKSNDKVIVKLIPKRKTKNWLMVHNKKYPAEILLHKMSNNISGVVKMLEFFEQENEWIIIMPKLFNCMDLFDYLESKQRGRLSEPEACHFFIQLVKINIDLLNQGVVHRDIKSENILVDLDTMKLILIDFGASAICRNTNKTTIGTQHFYTDFHGTRQYKPPEYITNKKYTALASTIWTLGILLYDMCNGQLPFETEQEILEYNLQIKANVSEEYKQLLFDCLKLDPLLRPNLDQVLDYSWCVNYLKQLNTTNNSTIPSSSDVVQSINQASSSATSLI